MIQEQWKQTEKQLKRIEEYGREQFVENKRLRIMVEEQEDKIVKYSKWVMLDQKQYNKVLKLGKTGDLPLSLAEQEVV